MAFTLRTIGLQWRCSLAVRQCTSSLRRSHRRGEWFRPLCTGASGAPQQEEQLEPSVESGASVAARFRITAPLRSQQNIITPEQLRLADEDEEYASLLADARPQFMYGRWRKARISARRLAEIRKSFYEEGKEWVDPRAPKIVKERHPLARPLRGLKGRKHVLRKQKRLENIEKNLKGMQKMIDDHHAAERKRRAVRKGIELLIPFRLKRKR